LGTQVPGDGGRTAGQAEARTAARRSKRPRHACDVGKGRPWEADPQAACARDHRGAGRGREAGGARQRRAPGRALGRAGGTGRVFRVGLALFEIVFLQIFE
jgi:hypothetical protein